MKTLLIARREYVECLRDGRLPWAGGLMMMLLLAALAVGWQNQLAAESERAVAQRLDYQDWLAQNERHPHDAAHQGMHVFKPQPPLAILDPGITPYVGSTLWLQAHRQSEVKFRPAQDATGLQRFGNLSMAWVLQILGPLLVIVLGFNAIAGEREQGTLRQLMSMGVLPRHLLAGKALSLTAAVATLLLPLVIAAAGFVAFSTLPESRADTALRFLTLLLAYVLYFAAMIFLVLAVSAWAKTSRIALVSLLAIWIAGATLIPRVASDLAREWHPSPTRVEFNRSLDDDLAAEHARAWQSHFGVDKRWGAELPLNRWGKALQVDDHAGYAVLDRHFGRLWSAFADQQQMQEWGGALVPLLAIRALSMGVAGTDFAHHRDFSVAAERQRRVMQDLISHDLVHHADSRGDQHFSYKAGPELWATVPPFTYAAPPLEFALRENWRALAALAVACLLAGVLALVAMPRRA